MFCKCPEASVQTGRDRATVNPSHLPLGAFELADGHRATDARLCGPGPAGTAPLRKLGQSFALKFTEIVTCCLKHRAMLDPHNRYCAQQKEPVQFAERALKTRRPRRGHAREHGSLKCQVAGFVLEGSG